MIRRLEAQRACLAAATEKVGALPGSFLELGLENGRTPATEHLKTYSLDYVPAVIGRRTQPESCR